MKTDLLAAHEAYLAAEKRLAHITARRTQVIKYIDQEDAFDALGLLALLLEERDEALDGVRVMGTRFDNLGYSVAEALKQVLASG